MDITPTTITTATNATTSPTKSPEPESETPTRIQQPTNNTNTATTKPLSVSNGVLKRHHPHHHHLHHLANQPGAVTYKECLKNHAASLGGHALDGCGEFMPSPNATSTDPSSIKCAACGCHRNFHRREPEEPVPTTHVIEYQPHHRHHPPPPPPFHTSNRSPNSASPPPISSSYYPSAPHMLLALSGGLSVPPESTAAPTNVLGAPSPNARKRFRTKFSQDQKEKMHQFAERVGWKMQRRDEELVQEFCNEVGVDRGVLKVWMHNNKNTFGKRETIGGRSILEQEPNTRNGEMNGSNNNDNDNNNNNNNHNLNGSTQDPNQYENDSGANVGTNGSSSSS